MSGYRGHIVFGIVFVAIVFYILHYLRIFSPTLENIIILVLVVPMWSILPDIDVKSSKSFGILLAFFLLAIAYVFWRGISILGVNVGFILIILLIIIAFFVRHRGFVHSILFSLLACVPLVFVGWEYALAGFLAFLSHLIIDGVIK